MSVPAGAWVSCPRCEFSVPLNHFVADDDEAGVSNATCSRCGERVSLIDPEVL